MKAVKRFIPCRYSTSGTQTTAYRTIQSSNVHLLAGGTPTEDVQISASEQVVYDGSVLARSSGSTSVNLTAGGRRQTFRRGPVGTASGVLAQVPKFDDGAQGVQGRAKRQVLGRRGPAGPPPEPSSYDANAEIKEMHGDGEYTLVKVYCNTISRSRRHATEKDLKGLISDTLRANVNTSEQSISKPSNQRTSQYVIQQRVNIFPNSQPPLPPPP